MKAFLPLDFRFGAFALCMAGLLHAQDTPVLPSGNLLNRAPDFSRWQVKCEPQPAMDSVSPPPPSATPAKAQSNSATTVVKTKDILRIEVNSSEEKTVRWCYKVMQFVQRKGFDGVLYGSPVLGVPDSYIDISKSDFPECAWVSRKSFTGVQQVLGHTCFVFKRKAPLTQPIDNADPQAENGKLPVTWTASIDVQTLLPVQAEIDTLLYTYSFLPPPTEMLALPTEMQAQLQAMDQYQKDVSRKPAHF